MSERRHAESISEPLIKSTAAIARCYKEVSDLCTSTGDAKRSAADLADAVRLLRQCLPHVDDSKLSTSVKMFIRKLRHSVPEDYL